MIDSQTDKPLRILAIVNLPWDPKLGAARVWIELTEAWQKQGHSVEKFCLTNAYPRETQSRGISALRQALFPRHAMAFVRRNADRFDVIDCLIGTIPVAKESLGFHGLLVARSVGLHRLYGRFHRIADRRWPDQPKGRVLGGLFYKLWARLLKRDAERAIRHCDFLNLPNESERTELVANRRLPKRALVQPYGLSDSYLDALTKNAKPAEERLTGKTFCFVGAWSIRKGARDWPELIRRIRAKIPGARFRFLGTMCDQKQAGREIGELGLAEADWVRSYEPNELPALLSDCVAGLFPSYVEGFGLGVLEQLGSGIPVVAYDIPGPHQILESHREFLLVPPGDLEAVAERAAQLLTMRCDSYSALSKQCILRANQFRWDDIARNTISLYCEELRRHRQPLLFTQPFSLASAGGGPRILRSLLTDAPVRPICVCTAVGVNAANREESELYLPPRPGFGRIERSRISGLAHSITPLFQHGFGRKLEALARKVGARGIHAVAHGGLDFYHAYQTARSLKVPFFLQLHDDVLYTSAGRVAPKKLSSRLKEAWQEADARFVISKELGLEYGRRYGDREFIIVTDGIDRVPEKERVATNRLRIYFMGLFHLGYEPNLSALIKAIELLPADVRGQCSITLRCDYIRPAMLRQTSLLRVLPFGTEEDVQEDLKDADCLYLPLHFDKADESFATYSLSTKMVTYLGSGVPILYHGPPATAASNLLQRHSAAALATSLEPKEIARTLLTLVRDDESKRLAHNALQLARSDFLLANQREKFWSKILACLNERQPEL